MIALKDRNLKTPVNMIGSSDKVFVFEPIQM